MKMEAKGPVWKFLPRAPDCLFMVLGDIMVSLKVNILVFECFFVFVFMIIICLNNALNREMDIVEALSSSPADN